MIFCLVFALSCSCSHRVTHLPTLNFNLPTLYFKFPTLYYKLPTLYFTQLHTVRRSSWTQVRRYDVWWRIYLLHFHDFCHPLTSWQGLHRLQRLPPSRIHLTALPALHTTHELAAYIWLLFLYFIHNRTLIILLRLFNKSTFLSSLDHAWTEPVFLEPDSSFPLIKWVSNLFLSV